MERGRAASWRRSDSFTIPSSDSTTAAPVRALALAPAQAGAWYHLAGVHDQGAGLIRFYINGVLQQTVPFRTPWAATGVFVIGRTQNGLPGEYLDGSVDAARAYNRALTQAEIQALLTRQ